MALGYLDVEGDFYGIRAKERKLDHNILKTKDLYVNIKGYSAEYCYISFFISWYKKGGMVFMSDFKKRKMYILWLIRQDGT